MEVIQSFTIDHTRLKSGIYTIDGKLFKSDQEKGIKSILFPSKDSLTWHLAEALYWRKGLIPRIGQGVGYNTTDFYEKLVKTFNVEFKTIQF